MTDSVFNLSPWNIGEGRFKCINSKFQIRNTIEFIRNKHRLLSICSESIDLPLKSVLLKISTDTFQIDKPIDWSGCSERLKIFFRDQNDTWNFITAHLDDEGIYQLSLVIPDKMYKLMSRWHKRVETPSEARASFHYDNQSYVDLQIINLSASGMLVCSGSEAAQNRINSMVNGITIEFSENSKQHSSAIIDQGIVVRSYNNDTSGRICHGITFVHKDHTSLENLHNLLSCN